MRFQWRPRLGPTLITSRPSEQDGVPGVKRVFYSVPRVLLQIGLWFRPVILGSWHPDKYAGVKVLRSE